MEKGNRKLNKKSLAYKREKDAEIVEGIFRFYEIPGGQLDFVYKAYKGDPVEKYGMVDGQRYKVPLGVAKHLNKNGWYPQHMFKHDEDGKPIMALEKKVQRFGFENTGFIDMADADKLDTMGPSMIQEVTMEQTSLK